MSHPTSAAIRDAGDDVVAHLEWCERCRAAIEVDVDLAEVRRSIVAAIVEISATGASTAARAHRRPWMVAVLAAAVVLTLFVPVAFTLRRGGDADVTQSQRELAERMLAAVEEEPRPLTEGDGWTLSIARRGPGFCIHTTTFYGRTTGDACTVESGMNIPGVLWFDVAVTDGAVDWEWVDGKMTGVVAADIDHIAVRFNSGVVEEVRPGDIVELGYRGFGLDFDATDIGLPVELEALRGTESQGAATVDWSHLDFLGAVSEEPRLLATGDGWSVLIARRGPGFCLTAGGVAAGAGGCWEETDDEEADLKVNVTSSSYEPDGGDATFGPGLVFGAVAQGADRVVVSFESGADEKALLGDTVEFGYRGFGLSFDGARTGPPVEVEAFSGTDSIAVETLDMYWRRGDS